MCVQSFHMVNIDVPAGVGAPPLNTTAEHYFSLEVLLPPGNLMAHDVIEISNSAVNDYSASHLLLGTSHQWESSHRISGS